MLRAYVTGDWQRYLMCKHLNLSVDLEGSAYERDSVGIPRVTHT